MFSVCSPENKFLGGCLGKMYFSAFGVYWSVNGGTPLRWPVFWNQYFSWALSPGL